MTRSELEYRSLHERTSGNVGYRGYSGTLETDGYRFHRGRQAFESDRARDVELKLARLYGASLHAQATGE